MKRITKTRMLGIFSLTSFLLMFFVLPNIFNQREERAFSDELRLQEAKLKYDAGSIGDSVSVIPGDFYRRGKFVRLLLGSAYRDLWQEPVTVAVLNPDSVEGGLTPSEFSGRNQTVGIKMKDSLGRKWSVRSVSKDQSRALPALLRYTILRPMFRDQACSLDPYAALAVARLTPSIGLHYPEHRLFLFPYKEALGKYNQRMAGRLVMLAPPREQWIAEEYGRAKVLDTDEMLRLRTKYPVDTAIYLRTRLFDLLISDWDRHEGNWKWILSMENGNSRIIPLAVDRDMAFYNYGDGLINRFAALFADIFASFRPDYQHLDGLTEQAEELDAMFLKGVPRERFLHEAAFIQQKLNATIIDGAFDAYPPQAYALRGAEHEAILKARILKLREAAGELHDAVQEED
jgi:hypothetical protein